MGRLIRRFAIVLICSGALWTLNLVWLGRDTRPPAWDMALHQSYALNYLPAANDMGSVLPWAARSGNYPPFVHWVIALCFMILHPGPHVAVLANVPATLLLFWGVYILGEDLAGARAARWACLLLLLTPYMIWISRETVLDYWLAAWVAAALVVLRRTDGFQSRRYSFFFALLCVLGLLTKWFFAGFIFFPALYVVIRHRIWRDRSRLMHLADAALITGLGAGVWYLPNLSNLARYFFANAQIGAQEGEPAVGSFQSVIYYLRLLEGYQLFGILFLLLVVSVVFALRKGVLRDGLFLVSAVCGGWLIMTLVRTKDPRFTLPLLGPMWVVGGAWIQSWRISLRSYALKGILGALLGVQAFAANFGLRWIPDEVVLMRGYSGSLRWDWNLYLQNYFHVLGAPSREDWKIEEILRRVGADAKGGNPAELGLVPDLARFNYMNFNLMARLRGWKVHVAHLRGERPGMGSFDGFDYVVTTEGEQGMPWTTGSSTTLNQVIAGHPHVFRLLGLYTLPEGNRARLYEIERNQPQSDSGALEAEPAYPDSSVRTCGSVAVQTAFSVNSAFSVVK